MTPESKNQLSAIMQDKSKTGLQKQLKKTLGLLSDNPKYPSLKSHPLIGSEEATGLKIWTSYVQNNTPAAHRILWTYSRTQKEIIILQIIPHY